ncbi:JAB domain-containing protein [Sphingomicrobium marinum]|uniref:JAB domain-containing protein n=1 Tax=Sphingomicrobium marinum TaxID=1227950 RepID=UPI00223F00D4|nr:DNA repair protein RadC [Sphingomicrobium marinum]
MADSDKRDLEGHRSRLRERIYAADESLLDHELIEYLLRLHLRRRDTKPIAKKLLKQYCGFGRLLAVDPETLRRDGVSDAQIGALNIARLTARRLLETRIEDLPLLNNYDALTDYLRATMAPRKTEAVRVLFLDAKNHLLANEEMWTGSIDESAVHVREIIARALSHGAAAIILVHNHPSGDPTPSPADIRITRDLAEAARHMKISLHDHIVGGSKGQKSLRAEGLL